jgi:hypothetical protein
MASRICLIVKSGTSKLFPYVSISLPREVRGSLSEAREDKEDEEGDCLGLSTGETVTELAEEEADESRVIVRLIAATRGGTAVEDIVRLCCCGGSNRRDWVLRFEIEVEILLGTLIDKSTTPR